MKIKNSKTSNIYRVDNLSKDYGKGEGITHALNNISFLIKEGELLCILGDSGSGKTTLLNLLAGLDHPNKGNIYYKKKDITKYNDAALTKFRRDHVGFVFQFFNLLDELTVYQNLTITPGSNKSKEAVHKLLSNLGIENKINKFPRELSGGEQQRVGIARALNKNYDILFCDEPTGALDHHSGKEILKLIEQLHESEHKTIVIVTHKKEIAKMCDRVIVLKSGQINEEVINKKKISASEVTW